MQFDRYSGPPRKSSLTNSHTSATDNLTKTTSTTSRQGSQTDHATGQERMPKSRGEQPLTCLFYFFHSHKRAHLSSVPDPDLVSRNRQDPSIPVHRLDTHLIRLQMHASFSPLIKSFDRYPVAVDGLQPPAIGSRNDAAASVNLGRDTAVLIEFRDKRAQEDWLATREWQEFYRNVNIDGACRATPHVRCARSLRGLMDISEVLTA